MFPIKRQLLCPFFGDPSERLEVKKSYSSKISWSFSVKKSPYPSSHNHGNQWKMGCISNRIVTCQKKYAILPTEPWLPIGSMYGIFTYIYHKNQPNVGKSTIHGFLGLWGEEYFVSTPPQKIFLQVVNNFLVRIFFSVFGVKKTSKNLNETTT